MEILSNFLEFDADCTTIWCFFKYKFYVHDIIFSKTNKSAVTNFHISYVLWVFLD